MRLHLMPVTLRKMMIPMALAARLHNLIPMALEEQLRKRMPIAQLPLALLARMPSMVWAYPKRIPLPHLPIHIVHPDRLARLLQPPRHRVRLQSKRMCVRVLVNPHHLARQGYLETMVSMGKMDCLGRQAMPVGTER